MEVKIEAQSVADLCERSWRSSGHWPTAASVEPALEVDRTCRWSRTDAKKLQQIVFNFLSTAVVHGREDRGVGRGGGGSARSRLTPSWLFGRE